jgi:hypothetical protein
MCHLDPQYSIASVREPKCTRLGYRVRLSRMHTSNPPLALAFPRSNHPATAVPEQENNQGTPDKSQVPQADPPTTRMHNSNQRRDKEKVADHMRVKICKNKHKTEAQFYEHNCIPGEAKRTRDAFRGRPLGRVVKPEVDRSSPRVRGQAVPTEPTPRAEWRMIAEI